VWCGWCCSRAWVSVSVECFATVGSPIGLLCLGTNEWSEERRIMVCSSMVCCGCCKSVLAARVRSSLSTTTAFEPSLSMIWASCQICDEVACLLRSRERRIVRCTNEWSEERRIMVCSSMVCCGCCKSVLAARVRSSLSTTTAFEPSLSMIWASCQCLSCFAAIER
jgi:hypothetical protein